MSKSANLVARTFVQRKDTDFRRAREQTSINIRKERRDESLAKRRFKFADSQAEDMEGLTAGGEMHSSPGHSSVQGSGQLFHEETNISSPSSEVKWPCANDVQALMDGMMSSNFQIQLQSLHYLRRQLCGEDCEPPFEECVRVGAVAKFVEFLKSDRPELHYEAAWALTNMASSVHTNAVVRARAIQPLIALLVSPREEVREQCAWCLANIAGDRPEYRNAVIRYGGIEMLCRAIPPGSCNKVYLENIIWSLSNMCRGRPQPPIESIMSAVKVFSAIIQNCEFPDIITDALWAFEYITHDSDKNIGVIVNLDDYALVYKLVQLLGAHDHGHVLKYTLPLLKVLGNIASGSDDHVDRLLHYNFLEVLCPLLSHQKMQYRKETCWIMSNIAAGSYSQARLLVKHPSIVSGILRQMNRSNDWDVRKEARWIVTNISNKKKIDLIGPFIQGGVLELLFDNVCEADNQFVLDSLLCLEKIFETIPDVDVVRDRIDSVNGIERLEALQEHQDDKIYNVALVMLEKFFGGEDVDAPAQEVSIAPLQSSGSFQFGMQAVPSIALKGGAVRQVGLVDPNTFYGRQQHSDSRSGAQLASTFSFEF